MHGHVQRRAEIKCNVRNRRKSIQISQPSRWAAPRRIARKRRVNVAVGKDQVVALKQRHDLPLAAVRKIRGVQERERRRCQQPPLLPAPRRGFHQRRRIPFREMQPVSADFQPPLEQIKLRALARPVRSFHHKQCARIRAAGNRPAGLRKGGFRRLGPRRLLDDVLCFGHLICEKLVCLGQ